MVTPARFTPWGKPKQEQKCIWISFGEKIAWEVRAVGMQSCHSWLRMLRRVLPGRRRMDGEGHPAAAGAGRYHLGADSHRLKTD